MSYLLAHLHLSVLQALPAEPAQEPLWRLVVRDFPRDAAAITLYVLLAASIALIWWANRSSSRSGARREAADLGEALDARGEEADRALPRRERERAITTDRRPATDQPPTTPRRPRRAA